MEKIITIRSQTYRSSHIDMVLVFAMSFKWRREKFVLLRTYSNTRLFFVDSKIVEKAVRLTLAKAVSLNSKYLELSLFLSNVHIKGSSILRLV